MINIKTIRFGSAEYEEECKIRDYYLRQPLGLSLYDEDLEKESQHHHIGAFHLNELVGCVILSHFDQNTYALRQLIVVPHYRGQAIGKRLVKQLESQVLSLNGTNIIMDARSEAAEFYLNLDYEVTSKVYQHKGISHIKMEKRLPTNKS